MSSFIWLEIYEFFRFSWTTKKSDFLHAFTNFQSIVSNLFSCYIPALQSYVSNSYPFPLAYLLLSFPSSTKGHCGAQASPPCVAKPIPYVYSPTGTRFFIAWSSWSTALPLPRWAFGTTCKILFPSFPRIYIFDAPVPTNTSCNFDPCPWVILKHPILTHAPASIFALMFFFMRPFSLEPLQAFPTSCPYCPTAGLLSSLFFIFDLFFFPSWPIPMSH